MTREEAFDFLVNVCDLYPGYRYCFVFSDKSGGVLYPAEAAAYLARRLNRQDIRWECFTILEDDSGFYEDLEGSYELLPEALRYPGYYPEPGDKDPRF